VMYRMRKIFLLRNRAGGRSLALAGLVAAPDGLVREAHLGPFPLAHEAG
jgi:hypothetical protein